jgi:hypothetical protein
MIEWSISKSKLFQKCQRKWYYYTLVASGTSNDPVRKQAHQLKQLQSISAWRGSIVDHVIQQYLIPEIKRHNLPAQETVLSYANEFIERQISFGRQKRHLDTNISKSTCKDFCAFFDLEYGTCLDESKLEIAKQEVKISLQNLMNSKFIQTIAEENMYVITQRELGYSLDEGVQVSCTPDVIVFFKDKAPLIADWKVHVFGTTEAWLQLGIYAVALFKTKPHKDFPTGAFQIKSPTEIGMIEYQLLKNYMRNYSLSVEDVADIEDYAYETATQMKRLVNGKKYPEIEVNLFQTTRSPQDCEKCGFKKLCWSEASLPIKKSQLQLGLGGYLL